MVDGAVQRREGAVLPTGWRLQGALLPARCSAALCPSAICPPPLIGSSHPTASLPRLNASLLRLTASLPHLSTLCAVQEVEPGDGDKRGGNPRWPPPHLAPAAHSHPQQGALCCAALCSSAVLCRACGQCCGGAITRMVKACTACLPKPLRLLRASGRVASHSSPPLPFCLREAVLFLPPLLTCSSE